MEDFRVYLRIARVRIPMITTVALLLTFGITENCSNSVECRYYVLRHFSYADIFDRFERIVAGTICLFLVARVANPNGRVPVPVGHTFRFRRALRAKAFPTIATMVLVVRWSKWDFTPIAVFYLVVRSPIRRCHLICGPGFQCFRWLQRNVRDGFSDIRNAINNSLRRILRSYRTI